MSWLRRGWDRRSAGLAAACLLVVAANAGYLARNGFARAGEPQAVMELSARELQPEWAWNEEDSGLSLALKWVERAAIDEEGLVALGFDLERCRDSHTGQRVAWGALELAGEGWRAWLADERSRLEEELAEMPAEGACEDCPEKKRQEIADLAERSSRLVLVAVDRQRRPLAERYAGRRYVAVVPLRVSCGFDYRSEVKPMLLTGHPWLVVSELHVPAVWRQPVDRLVRWRDSEQRHFESATSRRREVGPDYRATVAFGRRGVARLVAVEPVGE